MTAIDRLEKLFDRGGISCSFEVTREGQLYIGLTKLTGSGEVSVGGTYDDLDTGIDDCIAKLDKLSRKETLKVVK